MGVTAGDGFKSVFGRKVDGIAHDVVAQDPVEGFPFFGIFRHVHRPGPQPDPQIVHQPEGFHKNPAAGHNVVEIVSVGNYNSMIEGVPPAELYLAQSRRHIALIMVAPHPDDLDPKRKLFNPRKNLLVQWCQFDMGPVEHIAV